MTANRFHQGDRVTPDMESHYFRAMSGKLRERWDGRRGTVIHEPRNPETVTVRWDGRKSRERWDCSFLKHADD